VGPPRSLGAILGGVVGRRCTIGACVTGVYCRENMDIMDIEDTCNSSQDVDTALMTAYDSSKTTLHLRCTTAIEAKSALPAE
jgi:hypothetical protein